MNFSALKTASFASVQTPAFEKRGLKKATSPMQMIESNHVDLQPYLTSNFVEFERSDNSSVIPIYYQIEIFLFMILMSSFQIIQQKSNN